MNFLDELAARRRFGMKPGLETIRRLAAALGDPQKNLPAIHVAGTNGKGAVCAILDTCLREAGLRVGRYTSPHLMSLNERFFLDGAPVSDATLEHHAAKVSAVCANDPALAGVTFFEALTAVAFSLYGAARPDMTIFECGLGGRLDATNVCVPKVSAIARIGLDHCDWLGDTVEKIAAEKAGIVRTGVPVVLGRNAPSVRTVVEERARAVGAPFYYAPELADEAEIPRDFALGGAFNRENAVTALAVLKVLARTGIGGEGAAETKRVVGHAGVALSRVVWPGRFQRVGAFILDGAHNPPAAKALAAALDEEYPNERFNLIAGFCGDKDVGEVLRLLAPKIAAGYAVRTVNPRSLAADETARRMASVGIEARVCVSLDEALQRAPANGRKTLVCGSLFLVGEALAKLHALPWSVARLDFSESLGSPEVAPS